MRCDVVVPPPDPCGIIICSGRCGSTLLSTLIAEESGTLSVPESLGPVISHLARLPATECITGAEYWSLLSEPHTRKRAMTRIGPVLTADKGGIPPIMLATLPGISAVPDLLFSVLTEQVPRFPPQPVGLHHKMLLDLLAALAGTRRWVERSGASSSVAGPLLRAMPAARVVYLTRNISDTARSMSKHVAFRFALARYEFHLRYGADPYHGESPSGPVPAAAEVPEELRRLLPDEISAQALQGLGRDLSRYEAMCGHMMALAEQAFAELRPRHLHRMCYEDLVADPAGELTRLGEFLGFADPAGWATMTAGRVRPP